VTGPSPGEPPADLRDALIREQTERLAEQERRLAAQAEQIAALEAMVADLRDRLAAAERAGSRNSGNSSMPPSSDDLPGRRPPRKQRRATDRAEKKRGKQPDHLGVDVEQGQAAVAAVGQGHPVVRGDRAGHVHQLILTEQDALGRPGRPGSGECRRTGGQGTGGGPTVAWAEVTSSRTRKPAAAAAVSRPNRRRTTARFRRCRKPCQTAG
jgi:hypothetical protein